MAGGRIKSVVFTFYVKCRKMLFDIYYYHYYELNLNHSMACHCTKNQSRGVVNLCVVGELVNPSECHQKLAAKCTYKIFLIK